MSERRAFGERLRRQRERRNVTLSAIAETTKVAGSLFAGLERGDCSRWPGGMYNRSFIRGYAAAVGLNPDETAAEFAEYYEAPVETPVAKGSRIVVETPTGPPLRLGFEIDPHEGRARAAKLAGLILLDALAVLSLATVLTFATTVTFWIALAGSSISYQILWRVLGSVARHGHATERAHPTLAEQRSQLAEQQDEVPVSG